MTTLSVASVTTRSVGIGPTCDDHPADPRFLRLGVECANQLGKAALLDALLARERRLTGGRAAKDDAELDVRRAERLIRLGRVEEGEAVLRSTRHVLVALKSEKWAAFAVGAIAGIHYQRGEYEEALRIRRDEELPVYERLGDVRSRAVTMGKIADIHYRRGRYEEALRIRREEELPVYERLGDVRERAVTMGKIADIHYERGEYEEALRIRREEQLPVFERLGDARERAIALGRIADIHYQRGEYEEALRIRRQEQLPVYERLGDVRSRAVTMGRIADIHCHRGEYEEALRIRYEEELPVYERLGDVRERAVTLQQIAIGLLALDGIERGRIQEIYDALTESYQIAQRLGLPDGIAHAGHLLAQVMAIGGLATEALAVLDEVEAAFHKLGQPDGVASARELRGRIAART